jgi:predicted metal-dependent peptidase
MKIVEVTEAKTAFGRKGKGIARKYRCTSGSRKGRIVAKPSTCHAPKQIKKSVTMKRTKARLGSSMKVKRRRTMKSNPRSKTIQRLNKGGPKGR